MLKAADDGLSHDWRVKSRSGAAYTSGAIALIGTGHAACLCFDRVAVLNLETGIVDRFLPANATAEAAEAIVTFDVSPDGNKLVTFSKNQMIRLWDPYTGKLSRSWKGHRTPVSQATFDSSGTLLASGGSDRLVMVWDTDGGFATHSLRGHTGIITAVAFQSHPVSVVRLVSGSEDGNLRVWDLVSQSCVASFQEHNSAITALVFSMDPSASLLVSCGRDSVCQVWDTREIDLAAGAPDHRAGQSQATTPQALSAVCLKATIPTSEAIESAVSLPQDEGQEPPTKSSGRASSDGVARELGVEFVTVGDRGGVRKWKVVALGATRAERKFAVGCVAVQTVQGLRRGSAAVQDSSGIADRGASAVAGGLGAASADAAAPTSRQLEKVLLRRLPQAVGALVEAGSAAPGNKRKRPTDGVEIAGPTPSHELVAITRDQVLTLVSTALLATVKTIAGYHDQFTDMRYVPFPMPGPAPLAGLHAAHSRTLLAVATNSEQMRIIDTATLDTRLCDGHEGIVMSVAASPDGTLIASASKDRSVRLWDIATGACLCVMEGHTEAVTAVTFPSRASTFVRSAFTGTGYAPTGNAGWLASGSKDRTLKLWQLTPLLSRLPSPRPADWGTTNCAAWTANASAPAFAPRTIAAAVAHEKDINTLAVSPNDRLIASGSADKCVKLWSTPDLGLVATLRGHKRGVWGVAFSPSEQLLASCSGDRTIRLWSVSASAGYACLRTLEGHDASVLAVRFLRRGVQLVSTGADGLLKLWGTHAGESMGTFDAHADKVWALAVRPVQPRGQEGGQGGEDQTALPEYEVELVTAGGDSVLNVWADCTAASAGADVTAAEEALVKQSALYAAMGARDYTGAVRLTLELEQPGRCGDILSELLEDGPTPAPPSLVPGVPSVPGALESYNARMLAEAREVTADGAGAQGRGNAPDGMHPAGRAAAVALLRSLPGALLARLLGYIREWNSQSRHGLLAQRLLHLLLRSTTQRGLMDAIAEAKGLQAASETRMLPGIGMVRVAKRTDELAGEETVGLGASGLLAPLAKPARGDHEEEGVVGVMKASESPPPPVRTAAAAELRAFVTAALPYTARHAERLERLRQACHLAGMTLDGMHALDPADDMDTLLGAGVAPQPGRSSTGSRLEVRESQFDDEAGGLSDSEEEEAKWSGSKWLRAPSFRPTTVNASGTRKVAAAVWGRGR